MPNFESAMLPLKRWFEKARHKELKDVKIVADSTKVDAYIVTVLCRDVRTGEQETWVAIARAFEITPPGPNGSFDHLIWRKPHQFVPEDNRHDWGKNKDGIVECARCGAFRGLKNDKGFCPATVKVLPKPEEKEEKDESIPEAEVDDSSKLFWPKQIKWEKMRSRDVYPGEDSGDEFS